MGIHDKSCLALSGSRRLVFHSLPVRTSSGAGNVAGLDTEHFVELKYKKHNNRDNVQKASEDIGKETECEGNY
jgi:hypothetical protein